MSMQQTTGFFESLFDFSFTSLVTTKLIKVLYGLSIALLGLGSFFYIIVSFNFSAAAVGWVCTTQDIGPPFFISGGYPNAQDAIQ